MREGEVRCYTACAPWTRAATPAHTRLPSSCDQSPGKACTQQLVMHQSRWRVQCASLYPTDPNASGLVASMTILPRPAQQRHKRALPAWQARTSQVSWLGESKRVLRAAPCRGNDHHILQKPMSASMYALAKDERVRRSAVFAISQAHSSKHTRAHPKLRSFRKSS